MIDGGCPVIRINSPCPDRPLSARITVTPDNSATPVAAVTTGADGHFRIELPPGTYHLQATNLRGARYPAAQPTTVIVQSDVMSEVTVTFDSGIQ